MFRTLCFAVLTSLLAIFVAQLSAAETVPSRLSASPRPPSLSEPTFLEVTHGPTRGIPWTTNPSSLASSLLLSFDLLATESPGLVVRDGEKRILGETNSEDGPRVICEKKELSQINFVETRFSCAVRSQGETLMWTTSPNALASLLYDALDQLFQLAPPDTFPTLPLGATRFDLPDGRVLKLEDPTSSSFIACQRDQRGETKTRCQIHFAP